jgi:hypothetical protein
MGQMPEFPLAAVYATRDSNYLACKSTFGDTIVLDTCRLHKLGGLTAGIGLIYGMGAMGESIVGVGKGGDLVEWILPHFRVRTKGPMPFEPLRTLVYSEPMRAYIGVDERGRVLSSGNLQQDGWTTFPGLEEAVILAVSQRRPLAAVYDTGRVTLIDLKRRSVMWSRRDDLGPVPRLLFLESGRILVSSDSMSCTAWDSASGMRRASLSGRLREVGGHRWLLTNRSGSILVERNAVWREPRWQRSVHQLKVNTVASVDAIVTPDGQYIVLYELAGSRLWKFRLRDSMLRATATLP